MYEFSHFFLHKFGLLYNFSHNIIEKFNNFKKCSGHSKFFMAGCHLVPLAIAAAWEPNLWPMEHSTLQWLLSCQAKRKTTTN